jgi:ankyrin repeat protein
MFKFKEFLDDLLTNKRLKKFNNNYVFYAEPNFEGQGKNRVDYLEELSQKFNFIRSKIIDYRYDSRTTRDKGLSAQKKQILQDKIIEVLDSDPNLMLLSDRSDSWDQPDKGIAHYCFYADLTDVLEYYVHSNVGINYQDQHGNNFGMLCILNKDKDYAYALAKESLKKLQTRIHKNNAGNNIGHLAASKNCYDFAIDCLSYPEIALGVNERGQNLGMQLATLRRKSYLVPDDAKFIDSNLTKFLNVYGQMGLQFRDRDGKNLIDIMLEYTEDKDGKLSNYPGYVSRKDYLDELMLENYGYSLDEGMGLDQ